MLADPGSGASMVPMTVRVRFSGFLVVRTGRRGQAAVPSSLMPGEHDGQQVVTGWQPQRQAALVADQPGGDAEQFVAQAGGVRGRACRSR